MLPLMNHPKPLTIIQEKISRGEYHATVRDVRLNVDREQGATTAKLVLDLRPIVGRTDDLRQPNVTVTLGIRVEDAKAVASNIMALSSHAEQYA